MALYFRIIKRRCVFLNYENYQKSTVGSFALALSIYSAQRSLGYTKPIERSVMVWDKFGKILIEASSEAR